jgi:hypothetical protein
VCYFYSCFSQINQYKKIKEDGWVQEDPVVTGAPGGLPYPQGPLHRTRQGINCSRASVERTLSNP